MNWKRGFTRIYVVIWVLFAAAGLFFVWSQWSNIDDARATVNTFLAAHPGVKVQWLREMKTDSVPYNADPMKVVLAPGVEVHTNGFELNQVAWAAQSENTIRPTFKRLEAAGYWLLACGLAPAIILLVARWIMEGFSKSPVS
jgi:DMSO reductase anchor subunit